MFNHLLKDYHGPRTEGPTKTGHVTVEAVLEGTRVEYQDAMQHLSQEHWGNNGTLHPLPLDPKTLEKWSFLGP